MMMGIFRGGNVLRKMWGLWASFLFLLFLNCDGVGAIGAQKLIVWM